LEGRGEARPGKARQGKAWCGMIKKMLLDGITKMCNLQRDKMIREKAHKQKAVRKGSGFSEVLEDEQKKLKGGEIDDLHKRF